MPAFYILVLLGIVALYFLMTFTFKPIGKFFHRIWQDTVDTIEEVDNKE